MEKHGQKPWKIDHGNDFSWWIHHLASHGSPPPMGLCGASSSGDLLSHSSLSFYSDMAYEMSEQRIDRSDDFHLLSANWREAQEGLRIIFDQEDSPDYGETREEVGAVDGSWWRHPRVRKEHVSANGGTLAPDTRTTHIDVNHLVGTKYHCLLCRDTPHTDLPAMSSGLPLIVPAKPIRTCSMTLT